MADFDFDWFGGWDNTSIPGGNTDVTTTATYNQNIPVTTTATYDPNIPVTTTAQNPWGFSDNSWAWGLGDDPMANFDSLDTTLLTNNGVDPSLLSSLGSALGGLLGGSQLSSALNGALTGNGNLGTLLGALGAGYGISNDIDWQQLLGQGRDLAGKTGGLISGYTPYTGERVAGLDPSQQQAIGYAPGMLSQGQQMMSSAGVYDPNKVQDYLNPYVEGGLAAANRLTTQNLMENTLPGVNSTFTGNGQFGSTRNADFTNRAIRDNQQGIANSNAANMVSAYGNANQNYMSQLQNQGTMGQNLMQTGLGLGGLAQGQQQKQLDAGLAAWNQNRTMPLDMYKTWAGSVGNFNPAGANGTSDVSSALAKLIGGK